MVRSRAPLVADPVLLRGALTRYPLERAVHAFEQYDYEPLGEGVWAAIARPGTGASSNSGIVDTGRASLIFDTGMTPKAAHELHSAARILTGKEPLEVVNSHWHVGHTLGNRVFGGCTIRATYATLTYLNRNAVGVADQVNDPSWSRLAFEAETRRDAERRPLFQEELRVEAAARRDLEEARDELELRLPDETFTDRYVYPGGRGLLLVEGAGHSENDTVLYVPDADVMFAGDLVVADTHPDMGSAKPERWIGALENIEKTDPKFIVPGHGPVTNAAACATLRTYLEASTELARRAAPEEIPPEYAAWHRPALFARNMQALQRSSTDARPSRAE